MKNDHPEIIAPPPVIYAGAFFITLILQKLLPYPLDEKATYQPAGWGFIGTAFALLAWSFQQFKRWQTHVDPYKPSTAIIQTGPYRFSRNPIYVALSMLLVGLSLVFNTIWGLICLWPTLLLMQKGVIEKEEAYLTQKFEDVYTSYQQKTGRWL